MFINKMIRINASTCRLIIGVCCFVFLLSSCSDDDSGQEVIDRYKFTIPENFPDPIYTFENNPITKEGFELGKRLFYDPILSRDGSVSCNNCHIQGTAFADSPVHPLSVGVDNRLGARNAPSLMNMAFVPEFFWDGGVTHLDFVAINAIEASFEMDETVENIVIKLNKKDAYKDMYLKAFDTKEITLPLTLQAISQFITMMVSSNSRYDKYVRNEGEVLSNIELKGMQIFENKCGNCHSSDLFSDFSYRNNGLDSTFFDTGRNTITALNSDIGKFRVPSLRNVELTSPYMHHSRFKTLEEVLDHYENGMVYHESIDPYFVRDNGLGISFEEGEKEAIVSFLYTLTDKEITADSLFFN